MTEYTTATNDDPTPMVGTVTGKRYPTPFSVEESDGNETAYHRPRPEYDRINTNWHDTPGAYGFAGDRQFRATDDLRLLAVIERTSTDNGPDGDAYAPAYWLHRGKWAGWGLSFVGGVFDDEDAAEAVERAWNKWGRHATSAVRYLSIFHGVTVHELPGSMQGDYLLILDTPAHREVTGGTGTSDEYTQSDRDTWRAYIDGDVYGIGYAVNPTRLSHDEPVDLDATTDNGTYAWTVTVESYGYYGTELAREAALEDISVTKEQLDALTAARIEAEAKATARAEAPAKLGALIAQYDARMEAWSDKYGDGDVDAPVSEYEAHDDARLSLLDDIVRAARPLI